MPSINRAGVELHYEVRGAEMGRNVVLLHPLLYDHCCFDPSGLTDALVAAGCRVILPTSIAHRLSCSSRDRARFGLPERVADVQAVLDHIGVESFSVAGYSMGGWMAVGLAAANLERCHSLVIGGWDPVGGAFGRPLMIRPSLAIVFWIQRRRSARLAAMLGDTPDRTGLRLAFRELYRPTPALSDAITKSIPTLLWSGLDDPYHDQMKRAAADLGTEFSSAPGDHAGGIFTSEFGSTVAAFITAH